MKEFINKLEKFKLQLKSIHEYDLEIRILKKLDIRKCLSIQSMSEAKMYRLMLNHDWAKHRQNALEQLEIKSKELYEQILQVDTKMIQFVRCEPLYSLPNQNYDASDDDYFDTTNYFTKKFRLQYEVKALAKYNGLFLKKMFLYFYLNDNLYS
ncbi:unnamed protein product [Rotaria sordida]|uniref:Uncharacterized protein n=1 Tax=Rotaria sordida TaxID=392033 RepID=A0A813NBP3_9BILA|nr:unnamed protein product [Rotaria sordida]CAF0747521.1 unnamed protein product [Rotaria sordida]